MSAIPEPASRGSFMSIRSAVQQISGGVAAVLAGLIVIESADGSLLRFDRSGFVVIGAAFLSVILMFFINRMVQRTLAAPGTPQTVDAVERLSSQA